tara:strand:- start:46 stop:336 length:291 start_codon:yes stop_codon:yes gene_type:complete
MGLCSFCNERERESYWKYYCKDCAMLRRMLVLHNPNKCVEILKRCLIRNEQQITNKINVELKNMPKKENFLEKSLNKKDEVEGVKTRSQYNNSIRD